MTSYPNSPPLEWNGQFQPTGWDIYPYNISQSYADEKQVSGEKNLRICPSSSAGNMQKDMPLHTSFQSPKTVHITEKN